MKKISFVGLVAFASLAALSVNAQEKENHLTTFCDSGVVLEDQGYVADKACEEAAKSLRIIQQDGDAALEYAAQAEIVHSEIKIAGCEVESYEKEYTINLNVVDTQAHKKYTFSKPWVTIENEPKKCHCIQEPRNTDWRCPKQSK